MKVRPKMDLSSMILSPMPGSVVSIAVKEGDVVRFNSLPYCDFFDLMRLKIYRLPREPSLPLSRP